MKHRAEHSAERSAEHSAERQASDREANFRNASMTNSFWRETDREGPGSEDRVARLIFPECASRHSKFVTDRLASAQRVGHEVGTIRDFEAWLPTASPPVRLTRAAIVDASRPNFNKRVSGELHLLLVGPPLPPDPLESSGCAGINILAESECFGA